jgi:hypothetical protein
MSSAMITVPVYDKDGAVLLYDMWIDSVWHGSRRTLAQCEAYYASVTDSRGKQKN